MNKPNETKIEKNYIYLKSTIKKENNRCRTYHKVLIILYSPKVMITLSTGHVIASMILFNPNFTFRTRFGID